MTVIALCVPAVPPQTLAAVVIQESGGNPYAINVNGRYRLDRTPVTRREAVVVIEQLRGGAYGSFDIGLGQINSVNLERLQLVPEQLLDSCTNLRVAAYLLGQCYAKAPDGAPQRRLAFALSCYNTGRFDRGLTNGYVDRVYRMAEKPHGVRLPTDSLTSLTAVSDPVRPQNTFAAQPPSGLEP